jgi:serine/threonine protein kinase
MHNFNRATYDGAKVDVWAAGIVLFMLLFGRHPCLRPEDAALSQQQQMLALFSRTASSQFCLLPQEAAAISPACADLLGAMIRPDPQQR